MFEFVVILRIAVRGLGLIVRSLRGASTWKNVEALQSEPTISRRSLSKSLVNPFMMNDTIWSSSLARIWQSLWSSGRVLNHIPLGLLRCHDCLIIWPLMLSVAREWHSWKSSRRLKAVLQCWGRSADVMSPPPKCRALHNSLLRFISPSTYLRPLAHTIFAWFREVQMLIHCLPPISLLHLHMNSDSNLITIEWLMLISPYSCFAVLAMSYSTVMVEPSLLIAMFMNSKPLTKGTLSPWIILISMRSWTETEPLVCYFARTLCRFHQRQNHTIPA